MTLSGLDLSGFGQRKEIRSRNKQTKNKDKTSEVREARRTWQLHPTCDIDEV